MVDITKDRFGFLVTIRDEMKVNCDDDVRKVHKFPEFLASSRARLAMILTLSEMTTARRSFCDGRKIVGWRVWGEVETL